MRNCSCCNQSKPLSEFYKKGKRLHHYCKKCFNIYCMDRWKKRKIDAVVYKGSKCESCGLSYPEIDARVFDFHHNDPIQKDVDWNKMRLRSWDKIILELNKCSLLCANCHRLKHCIQQDSNLH